MAKHEDVEFKTADGIILRGSLFPAEHRGPGVVMIPGVSAHRLRFCRLLSPNILALKSIIDTYRYS